MTDAEKHVHCTHWEPLPGGQEVCCDCGHVEEVDNPEVDLLRAALGYALPTIGCGATADKIAKLLGYPEGDELDEYERRFLALNG